ncbi:hypothetical protein ASG90_12675 [Nocardioides sp. Soil797]|nr:hypothetical protein ASG90_12675 [Nocardioides sp. Soil797]
MLLLASGLAACGDKDSDASTHGPVEASEIADIVGDHIDQEPSDVEETEREKTPGEEIEEAVGAKLRYGEDGSTGDFVAVMVSDLSADADDEFTCDETSEGYDCAAIEGPGDPVALTWEEVEPEEDPGIVTVALKRGREYVVVIYQGDEITGDPRKQELSIPVDTMVDIARDERLTLG